MEEKDLLTNEETPAEEILAEEIPVDEIPAAEIPVEEIPAVEVPEETYVEDVPVEEAPVEEAPVEKAPVEEAPVEEAAVEEAAMEDVPVEDVPVEDVPVEEAPVEEAPVEEAPVEEVPAEEVPAQESERFTEPDLGHEITPDEHAMAWHGMTHPSEADQPFDMSILEDPDLGLEAEETAQPQEVPAEEEVQDQQFRDESGDFDEMFAAPPEEPAVPTHERPTRKGRPKRKKGEGLLGIPHLIVTCVWLAIIVMVGVTLGRMLWVCAAEVLAFGKPDKVVTVTVYESDTIEDVTEKLHQAGLIRYPGLFKLYASLAVDEGEIDPGIWDLNTRYDYHALVNFMNASYTRAVIEDLLIPEGYTCQQIFDLLEEKKVREIAQIRCVEVVTVKTQIKGLLRKFGCNRTKEIVQMVRQLKLDHLF